MTKRHFILIAARIAEARGNDPHCGTAVWDDLASKLADDFEGVNEHFNRKVFIAACKGVN